MTNFLPNVAVIGVGYVGFPLALQSGKYYQTIGYDLNKQRIESIKKYIDLNNDYDSSEIKEILDIGKLSFSSDMQDLKSCNFFIVTVPTPIDQDKEPDMSFLKSACEDISGSLKSNDIVVFESTVYPGAIEEFCVPILETNSGLKLNVDFFCGYSPERINPGDKIHSIDKIIKVTSGSNKYSLKIIDNFYKSIIPAGTFPVSSIKIAEASKVIENTQRDINIAFMNELAVIFEKMDINIFEVLDAAKTKWNFIDFVPGLVGGHCIGVDPHYLAYKSKQLGHDPKMILAGRAINEDMSLEIAKIIKRKIGYVKKDNVKNKILIFGLTFKENCPDLRNSKVFDLIKHLEDFGFEISIYDPVLNIDELTKETQNKLVSKESIYKFSHAVLAVPHNKIIDMKIDKEKYDLFYNLKNAEIK